MTMKDRKIYCLNNIAKIGTDGFRSGYTLIDSIDDAAGVLVRSADMKEMSFPAGLRAIARAGAGVNNIPLDRCAEEGIVVFNTPGANANSVKELVLCGMFLASRDIAGGVAWVRANADDEAIAKTTEKAKKAFAGHVPGGQEQAAQHQFLHGVGIRSGRVEDHDPLLRAAIQRNIVNAGSGPGDCPQSRRELNLLHVRGTDQHACRLIHGIDQRIARAESVRADFGNIVHAVNLPVFHCLSISVPLL